MSGLRQHPHTHTLTCLPVLGLFGLEIFGSDFDIRCGLVGIGNRSDHEVSTTRGLKLRTAY